MKYMHSLSSIAINRKIPIIVTNIVRTIDKREKENLEESISMYIHTKIKLSKNNNVNQRLLIGLRSDIKKSNTFIDYIVWPESVIQINKLKRLKQRKLLVLSLRT